MEITEMSVDALLYPWSCWTENRGEMIKELEKYEDNALLRIWGTSFE